jgi:lipid-A-disaccharide synthase-like uncharacterized protein
VSILKVLVLMAVWAVFSAAPGCAQDAPEPRPLPLKLRGAGVESVSLAPAEDGGYAYRVLWRDGRRETLSPDEFAELLYTGVPGRRPLFAFLNITSFAGVAWVGVGLLGQVLFAGRMLVQWLASERNRRSVVPVGFWWMSLGGATLLLVYFVWRKDVVGVLGQATGWLIYVRNLSLIYRSPRPG